MILDDSMEHLRKVAKHKYSHEKWKKTGIIKNVGFFTL